MQNQNSSRTLLMAKLDDSTYFLHITIEHNFNHKKVYTVAFCNSSWKHLTPVSDPLSWTSVAAITKYSHIRGIISFLKNDLTKQQRNSFGNEYQNSNKFVKMVINMFCVISKLHTLRPVQT